MQPVLEIDNLSISFDSFLAVDAISFSIPPGKVTAIVGESGSGKSLTALSILQLLPQQATVKGNLIFNPGSQASCSLHSISEKEIRRLRGNKISMIFQEPMTSLNPVKACGPQVTEAILQHTSLSRKEAKEKTIRLFAEVELPDPKGLYNRYPHQISGGQKQRVMIAMAICNEPRLLIADEPTTALDVRVQKSIINLMKKIQESSGMAVLFITHDLGLVGNMADEILVMKNGKIVESGKAAEVLQRPKNEYTKALLNSRPSPAKKGKKLAVILDEFETNLAATIHSASSSTSLKLLEVDHLSVVYKTPGKFLSKPAPSLKAVDDVSFFIRENEILGLVGESGCGKTTLGRALLQLIQPSAGSIQYKGKELNGMSPAQLRKMRKELQIVFQDPFGSLNPRLSIGDAIAEPILVHRPHLSGLQVKDEVADLLKQVKISADHYRRFPHEFSGGQRQRICIARALAVEPTFLVFDESVSALDVSVQAQVLNLINELKQELNFAALFISHDLSVVHYISDRIMVMQNGKIVETGEATQVIFHPEHEYTKDLITAIPGFALQ